MPTLLIVVDTLLRIIVFLSGLGLVVWTLQSAVRAFVLPRSDRVQLQRWVFRSTLALFRPRLRRATSYHDRDRVHALYAPTALLAMPVACLTLVLFGYTAMFWAIDMRPLLDAFILSGSSLFTLGFSLDPMPARLVLIYTEATIGLGLVALIISYLPTMYSAFSAREQYVAMLEVRAGDPPSAAEMIMRFNRLERTGALDAVFADWEGWFANLEETHTSLPALVFFRSPQPSRSWITAAGAVLDSAAIYNSCIASPRDGYQAALCLRAGYIALRKIADYFEYPYDPNPSPADPISIAKEEFAAVYHELAAAGVPLKSDLDEAWIHFAGWRVNYDTVLIQLAHLTLAPYAPWSSDRSLAGMRSLLDSDLSIMKRRLFRRHK